VLISRSLIESLLPEGASAALTDSQWGEVLTGLGLEVEGMTRHGEGLERIVVGRIEAVEPHPGADKLRVVRLSDGTTSHPVVCGAPNVPAPGGRVAFAPVGTRLPGGLEIAARAIRGQASHGMICSESELEIGPDQDGIMVLPDAWTAGERLADRVPGIVDTVYELSVTPNRPDALGHVGIAADLAVKLAPTEDGAAPLRLGARDLAEVPPLPGLVTLQAPDRCGRYLGRAFAGARIDPSPAWLRVRLHRLGLRPINAVVDITNYVLMKWGQPLHVFDRDKLDGGRVVVRCARRGEPLATLDGRTLVLRDEDLVIADASAPQALAGVIGGRDSGVEAGASNLVLEAAWFDPLFVRRTARAHALGTDSSYRFERGVDHGGRLTAAAAEASTLIETLSGARCIGGSETVGQRPVTPAILLRPPRTTMLLGMDIEVDEAQRILRGLEVHVDATDGERWVCRPPTHRPDLEREVDLIEEIMRHHGLGELPMTPSLPSRVDLETTPEDVEHEHRRTREERLLRALAESGLHEHLSMVFSTPEALAPFVDEAAGAAPVEITNPMRAQTGVLRTHMLPGLLDALAINVSRHARPVRLFESGRVYGWPAQRPETGDGPTAAVDACLPLERPRVGILLSDGARPEASTITGRTVAGIVLRVLGRVGLAAEIRPCPPEGRAAWLHPGVQARIEVRGVDGPVVVGRIGQVHPDLVEAWRLPDEVTAFYGELWVDALPPSPPVRHHPLPRFPATSRDLSLEIPVDLPAARVVDALREAERALPLADEDPPRLAAGDRGQGAVEILEDYRGQGIAAGNRALLLRLHYRASSRSVTDAEVQSRHAALVDHACASLRTIAPAIRTR
jgi:phenylalanyl-tRNA synthetase beta chain